MLKSRGQTECPVCLLTQSESYGLGGDWLKSIFSAQVKCPLDFGGHGDELRDGFFHAFGSAGGGCRFTSAWQDRRISPWTSCVGITSRT